MNKETPKAKVKYLNPCSLMFFQSNANHPYIARMQIIKTIIWNMTVYLKLYFKKTGHSLCYTRKQNKMVNYNRNTGDSKF